MGTEKAANARDIGPMTIAIAEELNALLGRRKMSAARLSREAGIPRTTLHKTLNALRAIDVDDVFTICAFLGEDAADLVARAEALAIRNQQSNVIVGGFGKNASTDEDEIPENVEAEWAEDFAASPKSDLPVDHTP